MKRWLFNITAVLSLLLMLATVGLWVRSYWVSDYWGITTRSLYSNDNTEIESETGLLHLYSLWNHWNFANNEMEHSDFIYDPISVYDLTARTRVWFDPIPQSQIVLPQTMAVFWEWTETTDKSGTWYERKVELYIRHWFLTLIFATLPALWLFKWNKRRKLGPNACPACGYDLTGNESGVCPECGRSTGTEAAQA